MYGKIENIKRFLKKMRNYYFKWVFVHIYIYIYILNEGAIKYNFDIIKKKYW